MFGLGVLLCALGVALFWPRDAARPIVVPGIAIHYAPAENLERIDVDLLDRAQAEIDIAAYVLTDVCSNGRCRDERGYPRGQSRREGPALSL
jgi:hypothetical protein